MTEAPKPWALAMRAAALLAVDPIGLGGATVRTSAGPVRDAWLDNFRALLRHNGRDLAATIPSGNAEATDAPWRRMPPGVTEGRLIGGLDLAATLVVGRPVAELGLLGEADGGVLVVPMAERLAGGAAAQIGAALDTGAVIVERDGIARRVPARFSCVLLDEGIDDERAPVALSERLAFKLDLGAVPPGEMGEDQARHGGDLGGFREPSLSAPPPSLPGGADPRALDIAVADDVVSALCGAGLAFGVPSLRVATLALRAAKASARLAGRDAVAEEDVTLAASLVIAPRATTVPVAQTKPDEAEAEQAGDERDDASDRRDEGNDGPDTAEPTSDAPRADDPPGDPQALTDRLVEATRAAIPAGLLSELDLAASGSRAPGAMGRAGAARQSAKRGRPAGVRRGMPGHGVRLAIVETLRAAAPWQRLRRAQAFSTSPNRVLVRREDFRVGRFKQKSETMTLFVVDASGSAALHRLAEVKGAVELILADCYVRRDSVALIAFRGAKAELILPPTRSLVRAKRALAGQAGGGGTPLADAIEAAVLVTDAAARRGQTPVAVFLTDGKANIGRAGRTGRAQAEADALAAALGFRAGGCAALVLDIAPRPGEAARRLAAALGARYIPLPYADAQAMSRVVLAAAPGP